MDDQSRFEVDGSANILLLHLDHMRDRTRYLKSIRAIAADSGVGGRVLLPPVQRQMQKNVILLVEGDADQLKRFVTDMRTQNVDVNSKGEPCKERMMSELGSQRSAVWRRKFADFAEVECASAAELARAVEALGCGPLAPKLLPVFGTELAAAAAAAAAAEPAGQAKGSAKLKGKKRS